MRISVKTGNNLISNPPDIPVAHSVGDDEDSVDYNHESKILGHSLTTSENQRLWSICASNNSYGKTRFRRNILKETLPFNAV